MAQGDFNYGDGTSMNAIPEIADLLKLARKPRAEGTPITRAALLADTASQLLAGALKGDLRHVGRV